MVGMQLKTLGRRKCNQRNSVIGIDKIVASDLMDASKMRYI